MMSETNKDTNILYEYWFCDLKKTSMTHFERAKLVRKYLEQNNLSI